MSSAVVAKAVRRWDAAHLTGDGPVVVGCSGGADSLALAAATVQFLGPRRTIGVTVDHGLQTGSAEQADVVAGQLRELGFEQVHVRTVKVVGVGGPEAAARDARQAALRSFGRPVLLGHTLDDQAETVLLGLGRGSGARSIAGMRPWRAPWGRPLLGLRRADTEAACWELGLTPWTDPHNSSPDFTRVRLRTEVLPLLENVLDGGVATALARTADQLSDDQDALDGWATAVLGSCAAPDGLRVDGLAGLPKAVRTRVLRSWLLIVGVTGLTAGHLNRLDELATTGRTGQAVRVPGSLDVLRQGDLLATASGSGGRAHRGKLSGTT